MGTWTLRYGRLECVTTLFLLLLLLLLWTFELYLILSYRYEDLLISWSYLLICDLISWSTILSWSLDLIIWLLRLHFIFTFLLIQTTNIYHLLLSTSFEWTMLLHCSLFRSNNRTMHLHCSLLFIDQRLDRTMVYHCSLILNYSLSLQVYKLWYFTTCSLVSL